MGMAGTVHFLLDIIFLISNVFNLIHYVKSGQIKKTKQKKTATLYPYTKCNRGLTSKRDSNHEIQFHEIIL